MHAPRRRLPRPRARDVPAGVGSQRHARDVPARYTRRTPGRTASYGGLWVLPGRPLSKRTAAGPAGMPAPEERASEPFGRFASSQPTRRGEAGELPKGASGSEMVVGAFPKERPQAASAASRRPRRGRGSRQSPVDTRGGWRPMRALRTTNRIHRRERRERGGRKERRTEANGRRPEDSPQRSESTQRTTADGRRGGHVPIPRRMRSRYVSPEQAPRAGEAEEGAMPG